MSIAQVHEAVVTGGTDVIKVKPFGSLGQAAVVADARVGVGTDTITIVPVPV